MSASEIIADSRAYASDALSGAGVFIDALRDAASFGFLSEASGLFNAPISSTSINLGGTVRSAPVVSAAALNVTGPATGVALPGEAEVGAVRDLVNVPVPDFEALLPTLSIPAAPALVFPDAPTAAQGPALDFPVRPVTSLPNVPATLDAAPMVQAVQAPALPVAPGAAPRADAVVFPDEPSALMVTAPGEAPEFQAPVLPGRPAMNLPDVPSLAEVPIPEVPSIDIPVFDAARPFIEVLPPTERFTYAETTYTSPLLEAATGLLLSDIENGGYGLDPRDEQRLWEREKDRQLRNAEAEMLELDRTLAARGFTMPTGAHRFALASAQQAVQGTLSATSRDIAIKRADLYQQNRQFALTTGLNAEQFLIQYHAGMAERSLNASKFLVEAGINLFNTQVQAAQLRLEQFRTDAQVFETRVRAAISAAEVVRVRIQAASLVSEINQRTIDLFRSRIDALRAAIDIYRTEMDAANVAANIERTRLEGFRAKVDAYQAQVRAKADEFGMFETKVRAQGLKLDAGRLALEAHRADTDTFRARVDAAQASAQIIRTLTDADIAAKLEPYRAAVQAYSARIQGFTAQVQAQAQEHENYARDAQVEVSKIEAYRAEVQAFATRIEAYAAQVRALGERTNIYEAQVRAETAKLEPYNAQVRGFVAAVDAARTRQQVNRDAVDADIAKARLTLEAHQQDLARHRQALDGAVSAIRLSLDRQGIDTQHWSREASLLIDSQRNLLQATATAEQISSNRVRENLDRARIAIQALAEEAGLRVKAADAGTQVYQNIVAGAMSSINALATLTE